jgi:hypothetical protein
MVKAEAGVTLTTRNKKNTSAILATLVSSSAKIHRVGWVGKNLLL